MNELNNFANKINLTNFYKIKIILIIQKFTI